jgi:outer membrane biosynthesis protein TonB
VRKPAPADIETALVERAVELGEPQLRVAHVWCGEVMAHKVFARRARITLGNSKKATFTTPDLGLPRKFAILQPGALGYTLSLGPTMGGRMRISGRERDVAAFVRGEGDLGEAFRSVDVKSGDWGVIELDSTAEHVLFFQFVRATPPLPAPGLRDTELLLPALAFALILHTVFIAISFALHEKGSSLVFPGKRELMTAYLVERPEPEPPPDASAEESASKDGEKEKVRSATKGDKGKEGGKGDKPRAQEPDVPDLAPEIETGLLTREARQSIRQVTANQALDDTLRKALAPLQGERLAGAQGTGSGSGSGFGPGQQGTGTTRGGKPGGSGGGGSVQGDFISQGKVDTGETRAPKGTGGSGAGAKEVAVVGTGNATGDFGGLSKEEIERVILARKGLIRACYQRELNRTRDLGGKLVVNFRIGADGKVQSVRVLGDKSSLRHPKVESCVTRQIAQLKFPAKGGGVVNYPFIFSQG